MPPDEKYILRPPHGCPETPPGCYWLLTRSLYGLKRSARHWFDRTTDILQSIGLKPLDNAPCIFKGTIIQGQPPLFLGLYVDDFVYFSKSTEVELEFQRQLESKTNVDFMGPVTHFLGHKFQWQSYTVDNDKHLRLHLSQTAYADHLVDIARLSQSSKPVITSYRSGNLVDSIMTKTISKEQKHSLQDEMRQLVGSLNWLSQGTRPDLTTITSMLAKYQNSPTQAHVNAAKYAIRYVKQTRHLGIYFDSNFQSNLQPFIHFPLDPLNTVTDANWGSQDLSNTPENAQLPLFKSRSISGHIIFLYGPLHWQSKRQSITARSFAEAEIYATDECVRELTYIRSIFKNIDMEKEFLSKPINIFNDNMACVQWDKNKTTRTIRHIQLRDNAVRENIQRKLINIHPIPGAKNIADIFTKEDRDKSHFISLREKVLFPPFKCNQVSYTLTKYKFSDFNIVRLDGSQVTGGVR